MSDCKYCERGTKTRIDYSTEWTILWMECNSNESKIVAYGLCEDAEVEINFCPFCGRQLNYK